jgi:hypothetical protein
MATTAKKKTAKKATKAAAKAQGGKRMSYNDVLVTYYTVGPAAIEQLLEAKAVAPDTVRKAAEEVRKRLGLKKDEKNKVVDVLTAIVDKIAPLREPGRGREAPHIGMEREYNAQKIEGKFNMRLPLDTLVNASGAKVVVRYEKDRIVVLSKATAMKEMKEREKTAAAGELKAAS